MSGQVLFETSDRRGAVWRLEIDEYGGKPRANFRKWFWHGESETWRPTREGVTFAMSGLSDLRASLDSLDALPAPTGLENLK